jgi:hypothetical protein
MDLRVLSAVWHDDPEIDAKRVPSWVPCWDDRIMVTTLGVYRWYYYLAAPESVISESMFDTEAVVRVTGFVIDTVAEYSSSLTSFIYLMGDHQMRK